MTPDVRSLHVQIGVLMDVVAVLIACAFVALLLLLIKGIDRI
jgi:hypothetical protein